MRHSSWALTEVEPVAVDLSVPLFGHDAAVAVHDDDDGGMAEYLLVPATRYLIPLGNLDPREVAPLTDAGLPWLAAPDGVARTLLGAWINCGGHRGRRALGQMASRCCAMLAVRRRQPCRGGHSATNSRSPSMLMGATGALSGTTLSRASRTATSGHGVERSSIWSPSTRPWPSAARWRACGSAYLRRSRRRDVARQLLQSIARMFGSLGRFGAAIPELIEVINLAHTGKIQMLVEHFPLDRAAEAYQLLHDGKIQGRAVITPHN